MSVYRETGWMIFKKDIPFHTSLSHSEESAIQEYCFSGERSFDWELLVSEYYHSVRQVHMVIMFNEEEK